MSNQNTYKTHCIHGHEFTIENTVHRKDRPNGGRKCRECGRIDSLNRKRRNDAKLQTGELRKLNRSRNLEYFYGLSSEKYNTLLKLQNYKCANTSCGVKHSDDKPLHVDHDHSCCTNYNGRIRKTCGKCIRGLLCSACNLVLGKAQDNETYLTGLVGYLDIWKKSIKTCG